MRYLLFVFTLSVYGFGLTQTYYLTGRPFTFERNNAIKEVGSAWGITVIYAGSDVVEQLGLDSINNENQQLDSLIALRRGKEWLGSFYKQVDSTEAIFGRIRKHIYTEHIQAMGPPKKDAPFEEQKIILHQQKRRTYQASIVAISNNQTATCIATYLIKWNRSKKMKLQSQCAVPYQFPENGIIIK